VTVSSVFQSILGWVRKGYPEGVPPQDYIPLLALLKRRLSDEEVFDLALELISSDSDREAAQRRVQEVIETVTESPASEADIERVLERLRSVGYDLDDAPTR
jgi:Protein of unknown function (DUF3349)